MTTRAWLVIVLSIALAASTSASTVSPVSSERDGNFYGWWHDAGELLLHVSNFGFYGSFGSDMSAPSAEWPAGSGIEHLYVAGPWVTAIVGGDTLTTTAAYSMEFQPPMEDPDYMIRVGSMEASGGLRFIDDDRDGLTDEDRLDGFDNDHDGAVDEDYGGISQQMFARTCFDTAAVQSPPVDIHVPLGIQLSEESYAWVADDRDDFVGVHYEFTNISASDWHDAYIAVLVDADIGDPGVEYPWEDDVCFVADQVVTPGLDGHYAPVRVMAAYAHDAPGGADGDWNGCFGIVLLNHTTDPGGVSGPVDVGPHGYQMFAGGDEPGNDAGRYRFLRDASVPGAATLPDDIRFQLVTGPYGTIAPDETVEIDVAFVCGDGLDGFLANAATAVTVYNGYYSKDLGQQVHWRLRDEVTPLWQTASPGAWRSGRGAESELATELALTVRAAAPTGAVQLELSLPERASVAVSVYDVSGRLVATLAKGDLPAGAHALDWSGRTDAGDQAASGVYFARAVVGSEILSAKVALIR